MVGADRGPFRFALVPFVRNGCFMQAGEIWPRPSDPPPENLTARLETRGEFDWAKQGGQGDWVLVRKDGIPGPENPEGQRAAAERARDRKASVDQGPPPAPAA